jgi:hypothetical protein
MKLEKRIEVLAAWGDRLRQKDEFLEALMHRTKFNNEWLTIENQQDALRAITDSFLEPSKLKAWASLYSLGEPQPPKTIGLVMAGNIPLVGFHDLLCVLISGHRAQIKLSEKDPFVFPYLLKLLGEMDPEAAQWAEVVQQLKDFDAVIATGSNNTARYFESYFGAFPNIIRKNRNGVAVLSGEETPEELDALGEDIFRYFGLGCRNVAKLYVPKDYNFDPLLERLHEYRTLVNHTKYKNNFDYNYALFMLNKVDFKANGCLILKEDPNFQSRIATLHYEYYPDKAAVESALSAAAESIQCIVARPGFLDQETIPFGGAQQPGLTDYADGVDTMAFLVNLNQPNP